MVWYSWKRIALWKNNKESGNADINEFVWNESSDNQGRNEVNQESRYNRSNFTIPKNEAQGARSNGFETQEIRTADNRERRTKQEWLEVARLMGSNLDAKSSEELTKYALQSWHATKPNQRSYKRN